MANSIQNVGESTRVFDDLDLLLFLQIIKEMLNNDEASYSLLLSVGMKWQEYFNSYSPGCIDLELESIANINAAEKQFLDLLESVERYLLELGETIPAKMIKQRWRTKRVTYSDYQVSRLLRVGEDLRSLFHDH